MKHKHAEMIKIWINHTELEVEKESRLLKDDWNVENACYWSESSNYRFSVPKDGDGNPVELHGYYTRGGNKVEVVGINQKNAVIYLYDTETNKTDCLCFWFSSQLKRMGAPSTEKNEAKEDKFKDFPDLEFVEAKTENEFVWYKWDKDCSRGIGDAPSEIDFAGYGYDIEGRVKISAYPVGYEEEGIVYQSYSNLRTIVHPKWVCFERNK